MFGNLFSKKSSSDPKPEPQSKLLFNGYLSTKKDIEYLEDKYDDFVVKSLQVEFDQYKQYVDANFPRKNSNRNHWMISEIDYEKFTLDKIEGQNSITINVYYGFYLDNWELKQSTVRVGFNSTNLNKGKVNDIIFQYFIYWKVKEIESQREDKKQSFQKMIDIIGKDVKRDSLIDQILS